MTIERWPRYLERITYSTFCTGAGPRWAERRTSGRGSAGGRLETAVLWAAVDAASGRPAQLSERFHRVWGSGAGARPISARLLHPAPPPHAEGRPWAIRATDLDVLGHVNNAAYWEAVEDELARRLPGRVPVASECEHRLPMDLGIRGPDRLRGRRGVAPALAGQRRRGSRLGDGRHRARRLASRLQDRRRRPALSRPRAGRRRRRGSPRRARRRRDRRRSWPPPPPSPAGFREPPDIASPMDAKKGPSRGRAQTSTTWALSTRAPAAASLAATSSRNSRPLTPRQRSSLEGKWSPMVPRPAAPRQASARAWAAASPSECPASP